MFLKVSGLSKSFGTDEHKNKILDDVSFELEKGSFCVILGKSGSGKSTLLNLIGSLDKADFGKITIEGKSIEALSKEEAAKYRRDYLGFVFQFYNLVPDLTARENIMSCEYLSKSPLDIDKLIKSVDLEEHQDKFPAQLSGGQQQRVAIARALIKNPRLLLCDEPTGALDTKSAREIMILLEKVNKDYGTTVLVVTHNELMKEMADHVITIRDGRISKSEKNTSRKKAADIDW